MDTACAAALPELKANLSPTITTLEPSSPPDTASQNPTHTNSVLCQRLAHQMPTAAAATMPTSGHSSPAAACDLAEELGGGEEPAAGAGEELLLPEAPAG